MLNVRWPNVPNLLPVCKAIRGNSACHHPLIAYGEGSTPVSFPQSPLISQNVTAVYANGHPLSQSGDGAWGTNLMQAGTHTQGDLFPVRPTRSRHRPVTHKLYRINS